MLMTNQAVEYHKFPLYLQRMIEILIISLNIIGTVLENIFPYRMDLIA